MEALVRALTRTRLCVWIAAILAVGAGPLAAWPANPTALAPWQVPEDHRSTPSGVPVLIEVPGLGSGSDHPAPTIERPPEHGAVRVYGPWQPLTVFNHRSDLRLDSTTGALLEPHSRQDPSTSLTGTDGGKADQANNAVFPFPFPDAFGMATTVAGDHLVVSAWAETNRHSSGSVGGGAIYVYRRHGAEWLFSQKLDGGEAGEPWVRGTRTLPPLPGFQNIAADEDDLLIGVINRDDPSSEDGIFAYRLRDDTDDGVHNPVWHFSEKLTRPVPADYGPEFFGTRVVMDRGWAFVGSNHEAHRRPERANPFDLSGRQGVRFIPDPASGGFRVAEADIPFDTALGTGLTLGDDDSSEVNFPAGFPFFGTTYRSLWVNSDGNVSFDEAQPLVPRTAAAHLGGPPRISPLFVDLDPGRGGRVTASIRDDRVAVTWFQVPGPGDGGSNTVQAVLHSDGTIDFLYGRVETATAIVGLGPGRQGLRAPYELDLSADAPASFPEGAILEDFTDERVANAGAVYVFQQGTDGRWSFRETLTQPDGVMPHATFGGYGMVLQGRRAVVTAEERKGYVYRLIRGAGGRERWRWTGQTLTAADNPARDSSELGQGGGSWRVPSMHGGWLLAGSPGRLDAAAPPGSVLFYRWSENDRRWEFHQEVADPVGQPGSRFGRTTALRGGSAVVAADLFDLDADGDGVGEIEDAGAAFVFELMADRWRFVRRLERPDPQPADAVGVAIGSLSLEGPFLVAGMQVNATVSNSGPLSGTQAGRATVYASRPLIVYTPEPGFEGVDRFSYVWEDGASGRVSRAVQVEVGEADREPGSGGRRP